MNSTTTTDSSPTRLTVSPTTASSRGAAVEITALVKSFGRVHAVRNVDLHIARGDVIALLGPNGAGKTTTIDMILGLAEPDVGQVTVFGMNPHEAISRGLVSAVMQSGGLLKDLTVRETVVYIASLFPGARASGEVLQSAGLTDLADRMVGKCSGGEQQRLRFAMALVCNPHLIILDEPTTGMDVSARRAFWSAIRADAAKGRTVVFATHYLEEADAYADRIVLMREGHIVADGTAAQIKAMGTTRQVSATWPGADLDALSHIEGVSGVERHGDAVIVTASDSDSIARYLLTHTPATDLEVRAQGLEEAFVSLTTNGSTTPRKEQR